MTTQALENLARARAAHVEAGTALDQAAQANSALLVRAAEARAKIEEAVREAKTNGDPTGKWAMQLRLATDDQSDIQGMLNGSQALLNERNAALSAANQAVQAAELAARKEESSILLADMQKHVEAAQESLLAGIAALHALRIKVNGHSLGDGTVWKSFDPSRELRELVTMGAVPRLRG